MFDYHLHSSFSADCSIPMEQMVIGAIEKNMSEICFTEHIDYEYPDESILFDFDKQAYFNSLELLQKKYEGQIKIKKGVEIGVQPHLLSCYEQLMKDFSFDFVICSMHTVQRKGLHYGELFQGKTTEEAYKAYYDELLECITTYKQYNVLGHVNLIERYAKEQVAHDFHDELKKLFNILIPEGKGIELNTSGIRYGLASGLPDEAILKLYKRCGGEIITLGSDAHKPEDISFDFKTSLDLLSTIGFTYISTFEAGVPQFHTIESLRR